METVTVLMVCVFVFFLLFGGSRKKKIKILNEELNALDDFSPSDQILDVHFSGIAIDTDKNKVCLIREKKVKLNEVGKDKDRFELTILSYRDVLSSEIYKNGGLVVTSTTRESPLARAAVGGLLFGGAGAIVGAVSADTKSSTSKELETIGLRITVNNVEAPIHNIDDVTEKDARYWHGLITVIIKRADEEDAVIEGKPVVDEEEPKALPYPLIADELIKLGQLKKDGLLTDDEFVSQKEKLLVAS